MIKLGNIFKIIPCRKNAILSALGDILRTPSPSQDNNSYREFIQIIISGIINYLKF